MDVDLIPPLSPGRTFWVEVPLRPPPISRRIVNEPFERVEITQISDSEYQSDSESDAGDDPSDFESLEMQEIVGEHTWPDGKTYLYARLRDQSIRKVSSYCLLAYVLSRPGTDLPYHAVPCQVSPAALWGTRGRIWCVSYPFYLLHIPLITRVI